MALQFTALNRVFLNKIENKKIEDKLNQCIAEFEKFRLNNDFEYGWKKRGNRWVVDYSTDITCWDCISQAKYFIPDDTQHIGARGYCKICILNTII